uniref:protein ABHD12B-like n=1 Tax=Styela clava TaxID=7725 RepID=UPI0019393F92|nr:protein ABHD12B-like [Styela clava]XP_039262573.1 protein ABHD12B-like [Styela clava]
MATRFIVVSSIEEIYIQSCRNQLQKEDVTIVLWGHSLGTYISTRALSLMYDQKDGTRLPDCLILEAPFTNTYDAADCFPLSKYFYLLYPFMRFRVHKNMTLSSGLRSICRQ